MSNTHVGGRYASLDYLRGLMALAVLVFHFDKWQTGVWDANSFQGRLGVYAVSTFFVLSGLSLALSYENRLTASFRSIKPFFLKRFWRIYPLLWLATIGTLLLDESPRPALDIVLNVSGLFGFVNPAHDLATGAWSIGCELVFYAFFPLLLWVFRWNRLALAGVFAGLFSVGIGGAFAWFDPLYPDQTVWWEAYVQVLNHAFFFVGGMLMAAHRSELSQQKALWAILGLSALLIFAFWPLGSEPFALVSGWNRAVLSACCLLGVAGCFATNIAFRGLLHRILHELGAISYALYLLHPLVYRATQAFFRKIDWAAGYWTVLGVGLTGSVLLSLVSYYYMEKPLMRLGASA